MSHTDWSSHIKIDRGKIMAQLEQHFLEVNNKITMRFYTLKPSGTRLLVNGICDVLHRNLTFFVYGEKKISEDPIWAGANAGSYFGLKDPQTDGKYGELLLFVLVESVLSCKMIAHKLLSLSNFVDQVKGGDGIFVGNYEYNGVTSPAYLIGESKVTKSFSDALTEAFLSLQRFHRPEGGPNFLDQELIVAQEFISHTNHNIDELYDRLTPSTDKFKQQVLVHPILLMYKTKSFEKFELTAKNQLELSDLIAKALKGKQKVYLDKINAKCDDFVNVSKVYLDFFVIPCNSVDEFRDTMFQRIHHVPYQRLKK